MDRLLVVRRGREETEHSPEFRYLRSWNLGQARAVFENLTVSDHPDHLSDHLAAGADGGWSHVLWLADDNVLLARRSLERMRRKLDEGCDVVAPSPLSAALAPGEPVYTLRGFERVEAKVLAGDQRAADDAPSHLPVSLWRFAALQALAPELCRDDVLANARLLAELAPGLRRATAGLYHQFVDYYAEVRSDILPLVPGGVTEVLEIGCARGLTGKLLKERLGCRVTGVELNPVVARAAARNLDHVLAGDIETLEVAGTYDLILALELFEHLTRQEEFLARMRALLRPEGTILLSVPNVGHHAVVEDLLAGRWDYLPIGLLCFTHFRFFTRATLENWFERCGFTRRRILPQTTELPESFAALAKSGPWELDLESLRTKGFYVLLRA